MKPSDSGFREIEHTADRELQVWAPDLAGLLEQAARGMYNLAGVQLDARRIEKREVKIPYSDAEGLLVAFLTELLYFIEAESIGFDRFHLSLEDRILLARLSGASLVCQAEEIKAVTYHNLKVDWTDRGCQANVVFDV